MRQKKFTISFIAGTIGVSVSTVCRELKPNSDSNGGDDVQRAVLKTMRRRAKSPGNRSIPPYVRSRVFELIRKQQWSPEQVSGWLKREEGLAVSKDAVVRLLKNCPLPVRTITTDNGTEFAAHEKITSELKAKMCFTLPYSSWEKGAIENTNGLIRLYIPKKTDLKGITRGYV